jgi:RNA polymerase sigma factor (sigma-70 family)
VSSATTVPRTPAGGAGGVDGLAVYLREAGRVPLLDSRLEARHARDLARSRRALRSLARDARRGPLAGLVAEARGRPPGRGTWPLDQVDLFCRDLTRALSARRDRRAAYLLAEARRHKRCLDRARDELILANLRLVVFIARKYPHPEPPLPDLIQEGNLGLMRALDRFDPARGNRFTTYAYWWIKQAIDRAIGNHARTVRVPVHIQDKLSRIRRVAASLRTRHGREPSTDEIAPEVGLDTSTIREIKQYVGHTKSLEDSEQALDHLKTLPDPKSVSPFEHAASRQRRRVVGEALRALPEQERQVLRMRYGLGRAAPTTVKEVGAALRLSRERVRQLERSALERIKSSPYVERLAGAHSGDSNTGSGSAMRQSSTGSPRRNACSRSR